MHAGFWLTIRKRERDFFRGIEPRNLLDLRSLAANLHPRLDKIESGLSGKAFMVEYAKDGLGMSLTIPTAPVNTYAVKRLAGDTIDGELVANFRIFVASSLATVTDRVSFHNFLIQPSWTELGCPISPVRSYDQASKPK